MIIQDIQRLRPITWAEVSDSEFLPQMSKYIYGLSNGFLLSLCSIRVVQEPRNNIENFQYF